MAEDASPLVSLDDVLEQAGRLVAGVREEQRRSPTPCEGWDVQALLAHLIGGLGFATTLLGGTAPAAPDPATGAWAAAYGRARAALLEACRRPGALEATLQAPWGPLPATAAVDRLIVEVALHSWDLAVATAQLGLLDPRLGEAALASAGRSLPAEDGPGRAGFKPALAPPPGASAYDRLAAQAGRRP